MNHSVDVLMLPPSGMQPHTDSSHPAGAAMVKPCLASVELKVRKMAKTIVVVKPRGQSKRKRRRGRCAKPCIMFSMSAPKRRKGT